MIRGSLLALLGLASFVAVYIAMAPGELPLEPGADSEALADSDGAEIALGAALAETARDGDTSRLGEIGFELRPATDARPEPASGTAGRDEVRDVTPPDMTAGPRITGQLIRVEPPAPEPTSRMERLFNAIVISADTIKVQGRDVHLAGIAAPGFDERCGEGAAAWPCGRMARAALRRFIRGRAIECEVPPGADDIPDPAICRVAGDDIAQWLVAQGWAKRVGELYGEEENAAREARLGLWGDKRPGDQTELAASG